jgi:chaperone protein EcpD
VKSWLIALVYLFIINQSIAGIVITGTRVIYPSNQDFVTVQVNNIGKTDSLVQSWVDTEDDMISLSDPSAATFLVTPPISKIEVNKGYSLRIIFTNKYNLKQDRETLFWLNVLEVPEKPKDKKNYLQFAVRSKLKLFYRPESLNISQEDAFKQVELNLAGDYAVLNNPTPYYINLGSRNIYLKSGVEKKINLNYISPFSMKEFKDIKSTDIQRVDMSFINDYGGIYQFK